MGSNLSNCIKPGNLMATAIMDYENPVCCQAITYLKNKSSGKTNRIFLQNAYYYIQKTVLPIYTLDEFQPASKTLEKMRGSCSQRTACLETMVRGNRVATRFRALWIDGKFWYPRFGFAN